MTPIYGRSICHGSVTAAVTSRDKMLFSNLQVSRPFTLDVTVLSLIYSVKMALSRPSQRHGIKILKRQMWVNREKRGVYLHICPARREIAVTAVTAPILKKTPAIYGGTRGR